jgi:hypothetical protein
MVSGEQGYAALITGAYEKNYFHRFFGPQKPLNQVVYQYSDALVGKQGKAVVTPNADAKSRVALHLSVPPCLAFHNWL